MDEQKQIEVMTVILRGQRKWCDISYPYEIAKILYNSGCRRIPAGSVVLTREEYEKLKRFEHQCFAMGAEIEESCQNGYLDGYERGEEKGREDSVDRFAEMIIDKHGYNPLTHEGDEDIEICLTASELYEICNKIKQNIKGEN